MRSRSDVARRLFDQHLMRLLTTRLLALGGGRAGGGGLLAFPALANDGDLFQFRLGGNPLRWCCRCVVTRLPGGARPLATAIISRSDISPQELLDVLLVIERAGLVQSGRGRVRHRHGRPRDRVVDLTMLALVYKLVLAKVATCFSQILYRKHQMNVCFWTCNSISNQRFLFTGVKL